MSDYVSEDTLVQILKSLPVKCLLRFRCVCKGWKQLIDSPTFLQDHLALQKPCFLLICAEPEEYLFVFDPRTQSTDTIPCPVGFGFGRNLDTRKLLIIGTLHGVLCLNDWGRGLLIWNPTICKSFTLTLPDRMISNIDQPLISNGFWIDPSTKEFKIITLSCRISIDTGVYDGHLYSSARHDWSVIPKGELWRWRPSCLTPANAAVMIGGVGHWLGEYINECGNELVILSFDFKQESFEFIEMTGMNYIRQGVPCRWQGKLSLLCWDFSDREPSQRCDLYSRQQGNSWVHIFGFDYSPYVLRDVYWALEDREEMQENGRVVATIDDEAMSRDLVLFDIKSGCTPLKSGFRKNCLFYMVYDFVESLLFP